MSSNNLNNYDDSTSYTSNGDVKKQQEQEAANKVAKTAAKGAATYLAGPVGGAAVDALANTKLGQNIINQGGKALNRIPGMGKAAKKLDDSRAVDMADKAIDVAGKNGKGAPTLENQSPSISNNTENIGGMTPSTARKKGLLDDDNPKDDDFTTQTTGTLQKFAKVAIPIALLCSPMLLVVFLVFAITLNLHIYQDALGISDASGGTTGDIIYEENNGDAKEFYERVNDVKQDMLKEGKSVDALKVVAVYHVISQYNGDLSYKKMSKRRIRTIAEAMFEGNTYSEETFRKNLVNNILGSYLKRYSEERKEEIADEIFQYITDYYGFIGEEPNTCGSSGSCTYSIKGFYSRGTGNINKSMNINNLKVRPMQCGGTFGSGTWGQPLQGEDLVDFEKYVLGVTYGEIGAETRESVAKAQLIAVRSFALSRPATMNNALGKKLEDENGQWILQMSSCVADQVYCDPDQGCSKLHDGRQGGTTLSGTNRGRLYKSTLAQEHQLRTWAKEVEGEVLINNQGNIINTAYTNVTYNKFVELANQGLNYKQILLQVYNQGGSNSNASDIQKMSCGSSSGSCGTPSTGEYSNWKQTDPAWKNVRLGSYTVGQIGCLATSVSILVAKSGVPTNIPSNFNPGTFVEYLNNHGGFVNGNFQWNSVTKVAPSFQYVGKRTVAGYSNQQKINVIKDLLDQGYYVVAKVSTTPQHWVAIDTVSNNQVNIMDPSDSRTILGQRFPMSATAALAYFRVVK